MNPEQQALFDAWRQTRMARTAKALEFGDRIVALRAAQDAYDATLSEYETLIAQDEADEAAWLASMNIQEDSMSAARKRKAKKKPTRKPKIRRSA